MNSYVRSMLHTLKEKKYLFVLIVAVFALASGAFGYKNGRDRALEVPEKQAKINTYLEEVERYDAAVEEAKEARRLAEEQRNELQEYIDNSVFMKLDPQNVYVGSVQYTFIMDEGTNQGNTQNAMNLYVLQGGLREDAGPGEELGTKYWGEVITTNINGSTYSVSIMQPTEELAAGAIEEIKRCMEKQVPVIAKSMGGFRIEVQDTSVYSKSEGSIVTGQNNYKNNLKTCISGCADWEANINNRINAKDTYIENNKPDSLEVSVPVPQKQALKFGIAGVFIGIWVALGLILIDYISGNRIQNADDLKKYGLAVIKAEEEAELLLLSENKTAVHIDAMDNIGISELVSAGNVILDVVPGDTRVKNVEELIMICKQYGVRILGVHI